MNKRRRGCDRLTNAQKNMPNTNTKQRHEEIAAAAAATVAAFGIGRLDAMPVDARRNELRRMAAEVVAATGCHIDTAKRNVAQACRRARHGQPLPQWGGVRPGAGRPRSE